MRRRHLIGVALAVVLAAWTMITLPPLPLALTPGDGGTVVRGAYHIHSVRSDGTGTVDEIAGAAARAGLQFVILTDHGDGTAVPDPPRYSHGVLCVDAVEISTDDGHYVALGMPRAPYPLGGDTRGVVEDVTRLGGFGVVAHPDSAKPGLGWHDWSVPTAAVEWFNADSQWRDERRWRLPPLLLHYAWRPAPAVASLFDRPVGSLDAWDRLAERHPTVGLAAHDAHQRLGFSDAVDPYEEGWHLRFPRYETLFATFAVRVALDAPLSGRAPDDAARLLGAIRAGHVFTAIDAIASPATFAFAARAGARVVPMGDTIMTGEDVTFSVRSNAPADARIVLFRNGRAVHEQSGPALDWSGRLPGAYRAEVRLPRSPGRPAIPWIVSNPVYVNVAAAREREGLPPATDRLDWPAVSWHLEHAPGSSGDLAAVGEATRSGVEVSFSLGGPGPPSPFVAAVTNDTLALRDATRVGFRVVADRPLRASVQFRLASDDPDHRWRRSFYADETPRDYLIAFNDFRPVVQGRGQVPPARIDALLFVVDRPNTAPGTRGRLRVERIRTER